MTRLTRRRALQCLAAWQAASPLCAQELAGEPPGRIAPREELVNVFEVAAMARRKLPATMFRTIADGERKAFDRITFRPRLMVNVSELDLTVELFGEKMFAPILVGPVAQQRNFHPDGESATVRGAAAAKAIAVISQRSSIPLAEALSQPHGPVWFQVYADPDIKATLTAVRKAEEAGCKAVCVTVGTAAATWNVVDQIRKGVSRPLLLKGIMNAEDARAAVERGIQGIVVSNNGAAPGSGFAEPIEVLPGIVDALAGKARILIDGGFRRGTDILKALAFGANAVLLGRPPMWGLAAYGGEGVQTVVELLQSELARDMALCGRPDIKAIDRGLLRVHRPQATL